MDFYRAFNKILMFNKIFTTKTNITLSPHFGFCCAGIGRTTSQRRWSTKRCRKRCSCSRAPIRVWTQSCTERSTYALGGRWWPRWDPVLVWRPPHAPPKYGCLRFPYRFAGSNDNNDNTIFLSITIFPNYLTRYDILNIMLFRGNG